LKIQILRTIKRQSKKFEIKIQILRAIKEQSRDFDIDILSHSSVVGGCGINLTFSAIAGNSFGN
jgi:7,8-dihydro-6-hydroxymethylpterin-pyrophosphokinase